MTAPAGGPPRRLTLADVDGCARLASDRDWPPEERKWRLLFEVGEVWGVDASDGDGLAATAIVTRYPALPPDLRGLAAISMVLVASRFARCGLGRRLMIHALARAAPANVMLYATELGRPLYERLGFRVVERATTFLGTFTASVTDAPRSRPATYSDRAAIRTLDGRACGADRSRLLDALPGLVEQIRVVERGGRVVAYAGAWRNDDVLVVGPVIAENEKSVRGLIVDLCRGFEGRVRLDLAHSNAAVREWTRGCGLAATTEAAIMVHDGRELPGTGTLRFVPVMQALG